MNTSPESYTLAAADSSHHSGVSWAAIFAGAAGAAALSLILLLLGAGLGFSAASPWRGDGASLKELGVSTIVWLMFTQILASGLGGYIAGRLRVKWVSLHDDEVYFRDTAHGFLAWAIATLVTATLVVGSASSVVGGSLQAGAAAASGPAAATGAVANNAGTGKADPAYFIDTLFRDDHPTALSDDTAHAMAARIFVRGLAAGQLSPADHIYLARVVAQRVNISEAEASQRIDQVFGEAQQMATQARQAADTARKVAAASALWMFVALLCGAFFASLLAIHGGRRRDAAVVVVGASVAAPSTLHRPVP